MKTEESLHAGHRERLKKRFDENGLESFEPHNALELLLFFAIPRIDTNEISHRLLNQFGGITSVFEAAKGDLMKVKGIGSSAATLIRMVPSYSRYYMDHKSGQCTVLDSTEKAGEYLKTKFIGYPMEVTYLVCLDSKGKILFSDKIAEGTVNATPVEIRKIVEIVMRVGAVSVLLAHNHPQGFAVPSQQDLICTRNLKIALKQLDVNLLDQFVVGGDFECTSMAESAMLDF